jgi:hypothetical protein
MVSGENGVSSQANLLTLNRKLDGENRVGATAVDIDGCFASLVDRADCGLLPAQQTANKLMKGPDDDGRQAAVASISPEFIAAMVVSTAIASINQPGHRIDAACSTAESRQSQPRAPSGKPLAARIPEMQITMTSSSEGSVEVALRHPDLGPVHLSIALGNGGLDVVAVVHRTAAADAICQSENGLRAGLLAQGITLKTLKVQLGNLKKKTTNQTRSRRGRDFDKEA